MEINRKKLMIIGGILLAVGIGFYFWKRKKSQEEDIIDTDVSNDELKKSAGEISDTTSDTRYSYPINPLLSKIENKKVASYLSNLLSEKDIYRLRGWLDLINKEKANDPTKWGDSNGLTGQVSRIGGALYQMKQQNKDPKKVSLKIESKGELWSTQILTDLQDAQ